MEDSEVRELSKSVALSSTDPCTTMINGVTEKFEPVSSLQIANDKNVLKFSRFAIWTSFLFFFHTLHGVILI